MHSSSGPTNNNGEEDPQTDAPRLTLHTYRPRQEESPCPHCGGAGWLRQEVPVGDPRFGKAYPCVCRAYATEERNLEELSKLSNLDAFQDKILQNFDPEVPGAEDGYGTAIEYAMHPEGWLLLMGGYGSGKTHLAAGIANYAVSYHRMQIYFTVAPDLLDYLRAAYAPASETNYDSRFEQIRNVQLLIIDDLGVEQSTPWAVEKLYQIFNYRYNNRLPTVITSNQDLDALDPRIRSRLCDRDLCRLVYMECDDYRMRHMDARFMSRKGRGAMQGQPHERRRSQRKPDNHV